MRVEVMERIQTITHRHNKKSLNEQRLKSIHGRQNSNQNGSVLFTSRLEFTKGSFSNQSFVKNRHKSSIQSKNIDSSLHQLEELQKNNQNNRHVVEVEVKEKKSLYSKNQVNQLNLPQMLKVQINDINLSDLGKLDSATTGTKSRIVKMRKRKDPLTSIPKKMDMEDLDDRINAYTKSTNKIESRRPSRSQNLNEEIKIALKKQNKYSRRKSSPRVVYKDKNDVMSPFAEKHNDIYDIWRIHEHNLTENPNSKSKKQHELDKENGFQIEVNYANENLHNFNNSSINDKNLFDNDKVGVISLKRSKSDVRHNPKYAKKQEFDEQINSSTEFKNSYNIQHQDSLDTQTQYND